MVRYDRPSIVLAVALSTLAGYVDAVGFLTSGGFFVSFMTGNSTRLGIASAKGELRYAAFAFGVVALFVVGVMVGTLLSMRVGPKRKPAVLSLVFLLLLFASAAEGAGFLAGTTVALLLAMGAENAVFQREGEVSIGVTYMTGTLVKLGQRLTSALTGGPRWDWTLYAYLWLGLVGGATAGTTAHRYLGRFELWPVTAFALVLAIKSRRIKPVH